MAIINVGVYNLVFDFVEVAYSVYVFKSYSLRLELRNFLRQVITQDIPDLVTLLSYSLQQID